METIGFVGLGAMGSRMAWNVADAGFSLCVHDLLRERLEPFESAGWTACETPREVTEGADVVIVMVTGPEALASVVDGEDGVAAGLDEDTVVINTSTVSPAATEAAASVVVEHGGRFAESPVSGTTPNAEARTLTMLYGGDADLLSEVEPVLAAMGDPVVHCGGVGAGTRMKLSINLLLGGMMQSFVEALVFGTAHGLDFETMREVIESGGFDAPVFRAKADKVAADDFEAHFPVDLLYKDLRLILDAAGDAAVPLPVTATVREAVSATRALGHGDEDITALLKHLETVTGTTVGNR